MLGACSPGPARVSGRGRPSPMLPDAAPESGRGALVGDDAAGGPRRPSSGRGRAAGGRDRGRTVVRARAGTATGCAREAGVPRAARASVSVLTAPCR